MNYINVKDVAKLVRKALKEMYPKHKFSVTITRYSGGSRVNIKPQGDNPAVIGRDVASLFNETFTGKRFDAMTDSSFCVYHLLNGERVSMCNSYVSVQGVSKNTLNLTDALPSDTINSITLITE